MFVPNRNGSNPRRLTLSNPPYPYMFHTLINQASQSTHPRMYLLFIYLLLSCWPAQSLNYWWSDRINLGFWLHFWAHNGIDQFLGTVGTMALGPLICFILYYVENTILKMTYFLKNTLEKFFFIHYCGVIVLVTMFSRKWAIFQKVFFINLYHFSMFGRKFK